MDEVMYEVYILTDDQKGITGVESTTFHTVEELTGDGYVKVDEGTDGYVYGHAQPNYLYEKYGKTTYDDFGIPNFKYENGKITELTDEEKQSMYPPAESQPTEQDLINADLYMQIAQLQMAGGLPMTMSTVSPRYNLLKKYYDMGIYNDENMKIFVACGWLTAEEYQEITGSIYVA